MAAEWIEPVECPIIGYYDQQRFKQFNPSDCANWYLVKSDLGKKKMAMYPTVGRRHISALGQNKLIFAKEPRGDFASIDFAYIVVANSIFRIDQFFNQLEISQGKVVTLSSDVFFDYIVTPDVTYAVFVDGQKIYVYNETSGTFDVITDANAPTKPKFIATFGNRIAVSQDESSEFRLSEINLGGAAFDPTTTFTVSGNALFAQEAGIIRQMGVLHNTLYIFCDFTTGIWSNIPSVFTAVGGAQTTFPWKKSTSSDWDYGIADPKTLAIGFGFLALLGKNSDGSIQCLASGGQSPKAFSTKAIDILFQRGVRQGIIGDISPFLNGQADGFLYQWENTIFYRLSAGAFLNNGILDIQTTANSIEYNFDTDTWQRVIEKNGERCRIQKHTYFNNAHLVTVRGDSTVYEMSGQFYDNEITNPDAEDPQSFNAYIREPFRYERVTPIIAMKDYAEFITDWVQIDFVWGENFAIFSGTPFQNAQFIIDEEPGADGGVAFIISEVDINGNPVYMITEEGNLPVIDEPTYNQIYKPHIELYWSDDGGVSFYPADVREFSQLGFYSWRMRWYELGTSRNRCYKLICVSPSPIVILGGVHSIRRASGGAA